MATNGKIITPIGSGEPIMAFDVSVTTTTATDTTVSSTLTFGRPFASAPYKLSAYITGSIEGRLANVVVDEITATNCVVSIRQGATAMTAGAKHVRVILTGELA